MPEQLKPCPLTGVNEGVFLPETVAMILRHIKSKHATDEWGEKHLQSILRQVVKSDATAILKAWNTRKGDSDG